jgi:hypothetical protein
MSLHNVGANTTAVKMKGARVGQITKTKTHQGKTGYIVSHDQNGEHPNTFSTKQGAKVGMAEMHSDATVQKWESAVYKKDFTTDQRKQLATEGKAMPDGSYPIENGSDLDHAISLSGMGSAPKEAIHAHIKTRAKALGLESKIPDTWKSDTGMVGDFPANLQTDPTDGTKDTTQQDPQVCDLEHTDEPDFKKLLMPTSYLDGSIQRNRQGTPRGVFDPRNAIS